MGLRCELRPSAVCKKGRLAIVRGEPPKHTVQELNTNSAELTNVIGFVVIVVGESDLKKIAGIEALGVNEGGIVYPDEYHGFAPPVDNEESILLYPNTDDKYITDDAIITPF
jgi:hypothetical protein